MRTTLVLDDGVFETARRRAFEQRRSLGAVISELAEKGIEAEQNGQRKHRGVRFGAYAGQIWMADDFDETPQEWLDAVEEPTVPERTMTVTTAVAGLASAGCDPLELTAEHASRLAQLALLHRDPFDRLLISQARAENLVLVTADRQVLADPDVLLHRVN